MSAGSDGNKAGRRTQDTTMPHRLLALASARKIALIASALIALCLIAHGWTVGMDAIAVASF